MQKRIETWFPKSVYINDEFQKDLLPSLEDGIRSLFDVQPTASNNSLNVKSSHTTNRKIHTVDGVFKTLSQEIMKEVGAYANSLGYHPEFFKRCRMADMWYNISDKGDYIFPHTHPGSFFSGAFYIKCDAYNEITFYDGLNQFAELPSNPNELSYATASYQCIPSRLLIFKSDFVHGVKAQEGIGEKIVISFNVIYSPQ